VTGEPTDTIDVPDGGHVTAAVATAPPAPVWIPLDKLIPHPDYPRFMPFDDIADAVTTGLGDAFPPELVILVRPVGDLYQIIDGVRRTEAERRKGFAGVYASVVPMTDDEAHLRMASANTQQAWSPLEHGRHVLKWLRRAKGGRGRKGGYSAYAAAIRRSPQYVSQLCQAAEVVEGKPSSQLVGFADKAQHLVAIRKAHRVVWPALLELILERGWSVTDTEVAVKKVAEVFGEGFDPDCSPWWSVFLRPEDVARKLATDADFTPTKVSTVRDDADETAAMLAEFQRQGVDTTAAEAEWWGWLSDNSGGDSWNPLRHAQRRDAMRNLLSGRAPITKWLAGDWREHIGGLVDGAVSAVISDPPYGADFQSGRRTDPHPPIAGDESVEVATAGLAAFLDAIRPKLKPQANLFVFCDWGSLAAFAGALYAAGFRVRLPAVWDKGHHGMGDLAALGPECELILHATAGGAALYERHGNVFRFPKVGADRHLCEKPQALVEELIRICTVPGDLIVDPFGGVATTAAAAKATGRGYWSCELDPGFWAAGEARLAGG
jgi:hypothetical protein